MPTTPAPALIRRSGGGVRYGAGDAFKLNTLQHYDQAITALGTLARRVAAGDLEVESGAKISGMVMNIVRAIHYRRKSELEERRLDLLGAAAEEGAAVFQGFAIIPPGRPSDMVPTAPMGHRAAAPVLLEQGPAATITTPKKRKASGWKKKNQ